jgi:RsiW-degrading membrane proteinase PrsW (M82 family)
MSPAVLLTAFLGGVVPAFIWLFFWLLEDRAHPEPKRYIFYSFVAGMFTVVLALPLERFFAGFLSMSSFPLFLSWATIEELLKFGAAYVVALRFAVYDEPLDAVVYLVTAALGFSALENALFLWTPLQQGELMRALVTEDLRFMGATLLHSLASITIGISLALSFYKPADVRKLYALVGVVLAVLLHTSFNFFILKSGNTSTFWIFLCIWVGIIAALLMTERVKQPKQTYS